MSLKIFFRKNFYLTPLEMADSAEQNRLYNYYMCIVALSLSLVSMVFLFIVFRHNLREGLSYFAFIGISALVLLCSMLLCMLFKNVPREKAYIFKNIPVYVVFSWGMTSTIYNSYLQNSPFIAVANFFTAVLILLTIFSVLLPVFFVFVIAGALAISPAVYGSFGLIGVIYFLVMLSEVLLIAVFKRYKEKQFIILLKQQKKSLEVKCFGNFTVLYDKKVLKFSRSKSTELLAYLIYKNGSSANTKELISVLYGDFADSARYGASLRTLISDIKHTLSALDIQKFFITDYNNFRINPEAVHCDYYDFLSGDPAALNSFTGEFMHQYSWAEDTAAFFERKCGGG